MPKAALNLLAYTGRPLVQEIELIHNEDERNGVRWPMQLLDTLIELVVYERKPEAVRLVASTSDKTIKPVMFANGICRIDIPASDMSKLEQRRYALKLKATYRGRVKILAEGFLKVLPAEDAEQIAA
jgi:hypothetical protein